MECQANVWFQAQAQQRLATRAEGAGRLNNDRFKEAPTAILVAELGRNTSGRSEAKEHETPPTHFGHQALHRR